MKRTKSVGMLGSGSGSGGSGRVQKAELVISKIDEMPVVRRYGTKIERPAVVVEAPVAPVAPVAPPVVTPVVAPVVYKI